MKTESVYHKETFSSIVERLNKVKIHYLSHRFQVLNEKFEWPRITSTADDLGEIFWMDYSENLTGTPKDQHQAAFFFNKEQFSLHCTVGIKQKDEDVDYSYHYHFSDNTHDSVFTHVINDLLCNSNLEALEILRFKSDNCRSQYKCKYVFPRYQGIARNNNKTVITYYGVEGHGKGLVDAMSNFGVKKHLRKATVTENFSFNSSAQIQEYFVTNNNDTARRYVLLGNEDWERRRKNRDSLILKGISTLHTIAYFPDGSVQGKVNVCSCNKCILGQFVQCSFEKGEL